MRYCYRLLGLLLLGWLSLAAGGAALVQSAAPDSPAPRVVAASSTHLQVAFETLAPAVSQLTVDANVFDRLELPGFASSGEPGAPAIPVQRRLVALPPDATVHLTVEAADAIDLEGAYQLLPSPTLVPVWSDEDAGVPTHTVPQYVPNVTSYTSDAWTPDQIVTIAERATWRGLDVVVLEYAPLQVNPAQQAVRYTPWARVKLVFDGGVGANLELSSPRDTADAHQAAKQAGRPYSDVAGEIDSLLGDLVLNPEQARLWQRRSNVGESSSGEIALRQAQDRHSPPARNDISDESARSDTPEAVGGDAGERWRVEVHTGGLQRLAYTDLAAAGVPVDDIDPRRVGLALGDEPVALWIPGEVDGRFNTQDSLYFYAPPPGSRWVTYDVYWLTLDTSDPLRMASRDAAPAGEPVVTDFRDSYVINDQRLYLPYDLDQADKWYQASITPPARPTVQVEFERPPGFVATSDPVELTWTMAPRPDLAVTRQVSAELNGTSIAEDVAWPHAPTVFTTTASVGAGDIQAENVLAVSTTAIAYFDALQIYYQRTLQVVDGSIVFRHDPSGRRQFQVGGLIDDQVVGLDVSVPFRPVRLTGGRYDAGAFSFASYGESDTEYLIADTSGMHRPEIASVAASSLRDPAHAVDYLVVSHAAFVSRLDPLIAHRASQGLRPLVVDVQEVYNEFGAGTPDPEAIRDFVSYAYHNWAVRPAYLLLVGDGTYDPLDYLGTGEQNWLPPYLDHYDPVIGETASDNAYATVDGDDRMPDIAVGRLAVGSAAEAEAVVAKILAYEATPPGSWQRRFLLTTDDAPDSAGQFYELSDDVVADLFPAEADVERGYMQKKSNTTEQNAEALRIRDQIVETVNVDGAVLVQYIGHAGRREWAFPAIWTQRTRDDLEQLHNDVYPFALSWTCWESYYIDPQEPALAEQMLSAAGKGTIGVFGPTGLDVATGHDSLTRGFYAALFEGGTRTLGGLTLASKLHLFERAPGYGRLMDTFMLHGDPALRLRVDSTLLPQTQVFLSFVTR